MSNPFKQDDADENIETQDVAVEEVSTEEQQVEENVDEKSDWQKKYEELNNQYIRLAADFDNYRKRQAQERENLLKYGAENTLKKIL